MINGYCPKCHTLSNMTLTTTERNEINEEGKAFKVITSSYYCEICNTFIKSEDKRLPLVS